ncbi:RNA-processing protein [Candidatus Woesearchaeota archaeon]|nr:RNA-processing protein [Candidatus Woesearchaeota archaeon]
MQYMVEMKIPRSRVAVLIGPKGEIKKRIEEATSTTLRVDSGEGDVQLSSEDSVGLYTAKVLVQAIGRGFSPERAMLLLNPEYVLDILLLRDYIGTKKGMIRIKGRVIGQEGKSRAVIEELTEAHLSVYGKTIGIIGLPENVALARHAVESLLKGSPHSGVFRWLERQHRQLRMRNLFNVADGGAR